MLPNHAGNDHLPSANSERKRLDFPTKWKAGLSPKGHEQSVELKVGARCGKRLGRGRRIAAFHFDPDAFAAQQQEGV